MRLLHPCARAWLHVGWSGIAPGMAEVRLVDLVVVGPFAAGGAAFVFTGAASGSSQLMGCSGVLATGPITTWVDLFVVVVVSRYNWARLCKQQFGFLSVRGWSELVAVGEAVRGGQWWSGRARATGSTCWCS